MAQSIAGTASIIVDGQSVNVVGEGTYVTSSERRESATGQSGYHGVIRMPMPGRISWRGRDASSLSIAALNAALNATVVLQAANGKTIIGRNMARVGDPLAVNTEDGTFMAEFEGPSVTEN